ncbi:NAD(P)-binding domain protein [Niveomyces insectorum RCEF 264]|uniref:NAD(P)-binding domain protein n=1 Tax=Niveomyces insectorum RCEF 264 TaxID=1081102 RepID=A0A167RYL0_9HYPO|nr:NAD(P)-binding domain protein [Niveomyces insectorum RCEF 264]
MSSLRGKVIAVSGAASGIGLATAKHLYALGAHLSLTDNRKEALDAAVAAVTGQPRPAGEQQPPPTVFATVTDVRSSAQVNAWIEQTVARLGGLDGAANLAGVVGPHIGLHDVAQLSDEEWAFVTDVNLTGVFYAVRAELQAMRRLGGGVPRSIVNVASTAGIEGNARNASYSAAKHGVVGLTRSAAKEVGREAIRVNAIAPGVIDTPMVQTLPTAMEEGIASLLADGQALGRKGQPEEVARTIAFLLGQDATFITGAILTIDGGQVC